MVVYALCVLGRCIFLFLLNFGLICCVAAGTYRSYRIVFLDAHATFPFLSLCVGCLFWPKKSLWCSEMLNALSGVQEESTTSEGGAKRKTSSKLTRLFKMALGKATTLN
jgi:hypothetical protein